MPQLNVETRFRWQLPLKGGETVAVRPIRPEDEPALLAFHTTLGERTVRLRYFSVLKLDTRIDHSRLARICLSDMHIDCVLVAERSDGSIIAVARLSRIEGTCDAEFAVVVSDAYQGKGLGTQLVGCLLEVAKMEKLRRVVAEILNENREMQHICRKLGFRLSAIELGDSTMSAVYAVPEA